MISYDERYDRILLRARPYGARPRAASNHHTHQTVHIALISDIHSNLTALEAVLGVIRETGPDRIYCLGDVVGYGAEPEACVQLVREHCHATVMGNHDLAVATGEGMAYLPTDGQHAADHNREALTTESLAWLRTRPLLHTDEMGTYAHASPQNPDHWMRLDAFTRVKEQFNHFTTDICFVGHTHVPATMSHTLGVFRVRPGHRFLVNVGSVGQPRDGDPRACITWFDTEAVTTRLERVPYNVDQAARRIRDAGLPLRLADRLHEGR